jgi:hypothetical protein
MERFVQNWLEVGYIDSSVAMNLFGFSLELPSFTGRKKEEALQNQ